MSAVVVVAVMPDLRPGAAGWDTQVKSVVAWNMIHGQGPTLTWAPAPMYFTQGSDGRTYAPYPLFAYLLQIPSALSGIWFGRACEGLAPLILLALTGLVLVLTGRSLGVSMGAAVSGALLACLGTALRPMVGVGHDNGIEALALSVTLLAAAGERPLRFAWAGLATGLALATRLGAIPLLVPAAFLVVAKRPRDWREVAKRAAAFSVGCVPGLVMILGFNLYRYGSLFEVQPGIGDTPLLVPWFSVAHWSGILGLTVSPGKGLLWYSPPLIAVPVLAITLARRFPLVLGALGSYLLIALVFYGRLTFWHGDWGWGPRYLSPFFLAAAPLAWWCWDEWASSGLRRAALALLAAGFIAVQALPNAVFPVGVYLDAMTTRARTEGLPAPRIVSPMLDDSDYFYFRLDTSPITVLARAYADSLRLEQAYPARQPMAEAVRRSLGWALLGSVLSLAACYAAIRLAGAEHRRLASSPPSARPWGVGERADPETHRHG